MMLVNTSLVTRLSKEQQVKRKYLMHLSQLLLVKVMMFIKQTQMQSKSLVVQTKMYYLSLMKPSIFTNKVTSTSADGIEAVSLQLQGDGKVARKITVGIATPSVGGAAGDIVLSDKPLEGGYVGWVYTHNNTWRTIWISIKSS